MSMEHYSINFRRPSDNIRITEPFVWNEERTKAAIMLAEGVTRERTAEEVGVHRATVFNWLRHPDFAGEVDRLTVMLGFASRAERIRQASRVLMERLSNGVLRSDKDSLDWIKYIQSETDGVKLDLSKLLQLDDTADGGGNRLPSQHIVGPAAIDEQAAIAGNADGSLDDQPAVLGPSQDTVSDSDASRALATDDLDHVGHS